MNGTVHRLTAGQGVSPAAAVTAYLATLSAATTRRTYGLVLDAFAERFAGVPDVADVGPDELAEWFTAGGATSPRHAGMPAAAHSAPPTATGRNRSG